MRGRTRFVAFNGAYHGDTTGAMAVSDPEGACTRLSRAVAAAHLRRSAERRGKPVGASRQLLERHAGEIAAIIVEPLVQGAGGMRFHDADVLRRLRALADRHELLLIFDEIFTGFGRTGAMFAFQEAASRRTSSRCPRR